MFTEPTDKKYHRYFGGNGAALCVISHTLDNARIVRIATAYFEPSGYQCLRETLRGKEVRLLLGRPESGSDWIGEVVEEFFNSVRHESCVYEEKPAGGVVPDAPSVREQSGSVT